jgi:hypothetical protein
MTCRTEGGSPPRFGDGHLRRLMGFSNRPNEALQVGNLRR